MNTPIADFLEDYEKKGMLRLHMPGHNGEAPHDITEIAGADSLYETDSCLLYTSPSPRDCS